MKKYILLVAFAINALAITAQIQVDSLIAKQSFKLNGRKVTGISNDISFSNADTSKLLTEWAAKNLGFVKIVSQNPTATLSGGFAQERLATGDNLTYTLNWGAGRQGAGTNILATATLATITVAGTAESFTQPSAPGTVSGTQTVSIARNTTTSFNNTVTTTDGKSANAGTSFTFYDKRYLGWSETTTPTNDEILAAVYKDNSGGTTSLTQVLAQIGTAKYLFYANTSTVSGVVVNGFPSTAAFSLNNSATVNNASGGTTTYHITVSNNPIGNVGTTTITFN